MKRRLLSSAVCALSLALCGCVTVVVAGADGQAQYDRAAAVGSTAAGEALMNVTDPAAGLPDLTPDGE